MFTPKRIEVSSLARAHRDFHGFRGFVGIFMYKSKSGDTGNGRSGRRRAERRVFRRRRRRTRAIVREKFLFFSFRNNIKRRRSSARHKGHLFFFSPRLFFSIHPELTFTIEKSPGTFVAYVYVQRPIRSAAFVKKHGQ